MSTQRRRVTYAYAVTRPFHPVHLWGVRGVDGTAVHVVRHDDLVAVVSTLPFTEVDMAALRARLENPGELEAIARAHHHVVGAISEHSVTCPLPVATLYESEQRLIDTMRAGRQPFSSAPDPGQDW
jgi:hypothetical protein